MSVLAGGAQKALGVGLAMLRLQVCMLIVKSIGVESKQAINQSRISVHMRPLVYTPQGTTEGQISSALYAVRCLTSLLASHTPKRRTQQRNARSAPGQARSLSSRR